MNIYFAGSIRGGRADAELYARIICRLQQYGDVLTEHVGHSDLSLVEQGRPKDTLIYEQDTAWLRQSDVLVAECTTPSLGVGYELAYAERFGKPCHILYNRTRTQLSAMLTGDAYYSIHPYEHEEEALQIVDTIMKGIKQ